MNKEDILAKSRKENKDEGLEHAKNKGRKVGTAGMSLIVAALVIYNFVNGLSSYAIFAVFSTYLGFEMYGLYSFTKKKGFLAGMAAGILAGLVFFVNYIISTAR